MKDKEKIITPPLINHSSKLLHGDALELFSTVKLESVRLIITDPPYNISRTNNLHTIGRRGIDFGSWDQNFDQYKWLNLAAPTLMPGGSIVIFNDWKILGSIGKHLETLGLIVKRILTIIKSNPFPRNINRSFVQATEHAIWAVKPGNKWVFNKRPNVSYETGIFKCSVQRSQHPTKKPDEVFKTLLEILSDPGEWVLDPFIGSGTTAKMAEITGRKFIGFEKDPDYYKLAMEYWKSANGTNHNSNE